MPYVTGYTFSSNFPGTGGGLSGSVDAFISALGVSGSSLEYSRYLGGSDDDYAYGIAIDHEANIYVTGCTASDDFPRVRQIDNVFNGPTEAFVTRLYGSLSTIIYSTFIGGDTADYACDIVVDTSISPCIDAYITGCTYTKGGTNYPTNGTITAYDASHNGKCDIFISKLRYENSTLSLRYSSFLGGSLDDFAYSLSVYCTKVFLTGASFSSNFPTKNYYDNSLTGYGDAIVAKFDTEVQAESSLIYSTYLGGSSSNDYGWDIAADGSGNAYVTGWTQSTDFPTSNAYDASYNGLIDVFVTKLNNSIPVGLVFSTYLGGGSYDEGFGIAFDSEGYSYITGRTYSSGFPVTDGAYDESYNGSYDVFVTKLEGIEGEISGTVTETGGTPAISGALVEALIGTEVIGSDETDGSGNYTIRLSPGTYDVRASHDDYITDTESDVEVSAGTTTDDIDFQLVEYGAISGNVDNGTNGIEGALVEVLDGSTVIGSDETDSYGDYFIEALPPSDAYYDVKVTCWSYESQTEEDVDVNEGTTTTGVDFTLDETTLYQYYPGDTNMRSGYWPPSRTSLDITYLLNYLASNDCCPGCELSDFYAAADVNGDCSVTNADVTRLLAYFQMQGQIEYCEDYQPEWPTPGDFPGSAPDGWPNCEQL